jgi:esterase/lipase superfamily enzyme
MKVEYRKLTSPILGQDMEFKIYGSEGKPAVIFPSSGGRFYEFEDFGLVEACAPFITEGKLQIFTVDSLDHQTWLAKDRSPAEGARRHNDYDRHIVEEMVPWIREQTAWNDGLLASGCSMGAYHSANFFFRHPDIFDSLIALSGVYDAGSFFGGYMDENVYFNSPLAFLPNLADPWYLDRYRRAKLIFCVGQGAWEESMLTDTRALQGVLEAKKIPAWFDYWGHDVSHDWPWWRRQLSYFLSHLFRQPSP